MTDPDDTTPDGPLVLDELHTPTLDEWASDGHHRSDRGWVNWVDPDAQYRVGVERVELPVVAKDRVTYAFEVTLWDVAGDRPHEECLRETIHNSRLAAYTAEFVATHAETFANEWDEGPAPRPKDVDPTVE